jgi:hypothetical protein
MIITRYFSAIFILAFLLMQGVPAEKLMALDNQYTERWNNGNVILPGPGTLILPKGPGILTLSISQDPFRRAGTPNGPDQIQYLNSSQSSTSALGLFLGRTYYQNGIVFSTKNAVTDGMTLVTKERYYSDTETQSPLLVQTRPAIEVNTDHQLANRVKFDADWEPFTTGWAADKGCDVYGSWNTSRGVLNISSTSGMFELVTVKGDYLNKQTGGPVDGTLRGPVLTGTWQGGNDLQGRAGRFTLFFKDDCCSFSGTYGSGESDSNLGDWSGYRK